MSRMYWGNSVLQYLMLYHFYIIIIIIIIIIITTTTINITKVKNCLDFIFLCVLCFLLYNCPLGG
jgi:hypothetical protein